MATAADQTRTATPGRPSATEDTALRIRNFRWLFAVAIMKERVEAIAAAEPTPVHPETVRRGVESARALILGSADGRESRMVDISAFVDRRRRRKTAPA